MLFRIITVLAVIALGGQHVDIEQSRSATGAVQRNTGRQPRLLSEERVLTDYDAAGDPSVRIEAERIDQIGHTNEVALINVRIDYQAPGGQSWVMVGDMAHVQPGGKVVDMRATCACRASPAAPGHRNGSNRYSELRHSRRGGEHQERRAHRIRRHTLTARGLVANLKERTRCA
jgi:hypothetical protein